MKRSQKSKFQPFLSRLSKDLRENPERIKPFRLSLLEKARELVKGIKVEP